MRDKQQQYSTNKKVKFDDKVQVREVENWKLYNVDMTKKIPIDTENKEATCGCLIF